MAKHKIPTLDMSVTPATNPSHVREADPAPNPPPPVGTQRTGPLDPAAIHDRYAPIGAPGTGLHDGLPPAMKQPGPQKQKQPHPQKLKTKEERRGLPPSAKTLGARKP